MPDFLHEAVQSIFDVPVEVGVTDPQAVPGDLFAEEAFHIARARTVRRREFAAGRTAARQALHGLGMRAQPIPVSADRSPIWPSGVAGSISHAQTLCIAAVTKAARSIGLDVEADTPLDMDLIPAICSPLERARIDGVADGSAAKLIFCAKEAVYKAQYPLTKLFFGFDHIDVTLRPETETFAATFLKPAGLFSVGHVLNGRITRYAGHILAGVTIGPNASAGG